MAPAERATWLRSDQLLARSIGQPIARFLAIEAAGGLLLVAAAVVALGVGQLARGRTPTSTSGTPSSPSRSAATSSSEDLQHWINDGLMTLFFFVIGLEIKHEVSHGQLTSPRAAAVPIAGAVGGMVVPALLYVAINLGGDGASAGGSRWPPTSPSPSVCSPSSATGCRASSRCCCSGWPSSTTSAPSS